MTQRLRFDEDHVLTVPVGEHALVLRLHAMAWRLDVAMPVLGTAVAGGPLLALRGHVAGLYVHSLAVHSAHVRRCWLAAGPDPGAMLEPLPHVSGKVFIPAQCDERGKIVAHAVLPDFGRSTARAFGNESWRHLFMFLII